jgi:hypothetical protein
MRVFCLLTLVRHEEPDNIFRDKRGRHFAGFSKFLEHADPFPKQAGSGTGALRAPKVRDVRFGLSPGYVLEPVS